MSRLPQESKVIVVGAGISGLVTAYLLQSFGHAVTVLEEKERVGGCIETLIEEGFLVELGPNSALETTPLIGRILSELGISSRLLYANDKAKNRYIVRRGKLYRVPMSPPAFVASPLFSTRAKLRLLGEPFIRPAGREESLADFVRRRFGGEFLDYAINPFVAGVYAGDPEKLSVEAAFPKLCELERRYGSVLGGALKGRRERKERERRGEVSKQSARLFSFDKGLSTLTDAIAAKLRPEPFTGRKVLAVRRLSGGDAERFAVIYDERGAERELEAHHVVLSIPAYSAAGLIRPLEGSLADELAGIDYPPVAMIFTGYRADSVARDLDGFGFLVPEIENRKILGAIWSSTIFSGRAGKGHVAFTTFVGGSRQPELALSGDRELERVVEAELRYFHGIEGGPVYRKLRVWPRAIPQYSLSHTALMEKLERFERENPGLWFCANFRGGISIADCIQSAERTAKRIAGISG